MSFFNFGKEVTIIFDAEQDSDGTYRVTGFVGEAKAEASIIQHLGQEHYGFVDCDSPAPAPSPSAAADNPCAYDYDLCADYQGSTPRSI